MSKLNRGLFCVLFSVAEGSANIKVARKTIRVIGNVFPEDMANEIRAVEKLCSLDKGNLLLASSSFPSSIELHRHVFKRSA